MRRLRLSMVYFSKLWFKYRRLKKAVIELRRKLREAQDEIEFMRAENSRLHLEWAGKFLISHKLTPISQPEPQSPPVEDLALEFTPGQVAAYFDFKNKFFEQGRELGYDDLKIEKFWEDREPTVKNDVKAMYQ